MIKIQNLSKKYDRTQALDDFSLSIGRGEFWGLIGPNGAGKTTLYKSLLGLLTIDNGSIIIDGKKVDKHPEHIKKIIGYAAEPPVLYEYLTGPEFLEFTGTLNGIEKNELVQKINHLLKEFDLEFKSKDPIADYSHGMRKKISLAAAFLKEPSILLLDEPTSGLDAESIYNLKNHLLSFRDKGVTLLLSSHIIETVEKLCSHVAIINKGRIIYKDTIENIYSALGPGETLETLLIRLLRESE